MTAQEAINHAKEHAPKAAMRSSADLCIADAEQLLREGNEAAARFRAAKSIAYSLGFHSELYREIMESK